MQKNLFSLLLICSVSLMAFADLREGVLPAEFNVSPTKKVRFAQGNVQSGRSGFIRFAEHQYDFVGAANRNVSSYSYSGFFDLFGWGQNFNTYTTDLADYQTFTDWGKWSFYNGDPDAEWRTLNTEEWKYLLFESGAGVGMGTVNGTKGLLIFPSSLVQALSQTDTPFVSIMKEGKAQKVQEHTLYGYDIKETQFTDNKYTAERWEEELEPLGAVFLPAAYYRTTASSSATTVEAVLYKGIGSGYYWSSTPVNNQAEYAYFMLFGENQYPSATSYVYGASGESYKRYTGMSVRLVTEKGEYNPVLDLDTLKVDTYEDTNITFSYEGASSPAVLLTLQQDDYFDDANNCLVLATPLEDATVTELMDDALDNTGNFSNTFSGVSFFLPAGSGEIELDMCTSGLEQSVHIGDSEPIHLTQNERGTATVEYDIAESQLICIHAIESNTGNAAPKRARTHIKEELKKVELYGIKIVPDKDPSAIDQIEANSSTLNSKCLVNGHLFILRNGKTYSISGQEMK